MFVTALSLSEWLVLRGRASRNNVAVSIAANTTITDLTSGDAVLPLGSDEAVLVEAIQFTGVQAGLVSYTFMFNNGEFVGYAIEGQRIPINMIASGQVRYQIKNGMATACVCNIITVSVPFEVWDRDVLELIGETRVGGPFEVPVHDRW